MGNERHDDVASSLADLFNILTIHGIAAVDELPKSVLDLNQFWRTTSYKVGAYFYSLDDIQHGVLRGKLECTSRPVGIERRRPREQAALELYATTFHIQRSARALLNASL